MTKQQRNSRAAAITAAVQSFAEALYKGVERAAEIYSKTITKWPEAQKDFKAKMPAFAPIDWDVLLAIAREDLPVSLFYKPDASLRLLLELPVTARGPLLDGGVAVYHEASDSHMKLTYENMTDSQKEMVIGVLTVRDLAAQKLWCKNRDAALAAAKKIKDQTAAVDDYQVVGKRAPRKVRFLTRTLWSADDVAALLAKLQA